MLGVCLLGSVCGELSYGREESMCRGLLLGKSMAFSKNREGAREEREHGVKILKCLGRIKSEHAFIYIYITYNSVMSPNMLSHVISVVG